METHDTKGTFAIDACPLCAARVPDRGKEAGVWDGTLGVGFGSFWITKCAACGAELFGIQYFEDGEGPPQQGGLVSRVQWYGEPPGKTDGGAVAG
jgi:hypothetical protein